MMIEGEFRERTRNVRVEQSFFFISFLICDVDTDTSSNSVIGTKKSSSANHKVSVTK